MQRVITEAFPNSAEIGLEGIISALKYVLEYRLNEVGGDVQEQAVKEEAAREIMLNHRDIIPGEDDEAKIQYLLDSVSK